MGDVARTEAIRWPGNSARNEDRCAERVSDGRDSGQRDSGNGAPSRRGSFAASDGRRSSLAACDRRRDSLHRRASFQTERSSFQVLEDHMRIMMRSVRQASLSEDAADASQDSLATGSPARASTPEAARMDRESVRARAAHGQRASVSPAVKPRTGVFAKLGKRAEEAVRTLAKNAKRRQKIHKLWTWAIGKVLFSLRFASTLVLTAQHAGHQDDPSDQCHHFQKLLRYSSGSTHARGNSCCTQEAKRIVWVGRVGLQAGHLQSSG
ncbi:hypothetical protein BC830DRAFT_91114 [Chytriomyces sp. MP71]|nr:hypothetical protein BC830DRAFT_91114 [Chytriomyces sp. MP71]